MQDPDIIQDVRIVKAKDRTYIQGVWGNPKEKHLVVEISEKQRPKRRDFVDILAKKPFGGGKTKSMANQLTSDCFNEEKHQQRTAPVSTFQVCNLMSPRTL